MNLEWKRSGFWYRLGRVTALTRDGRAGTVDDVMRPRRRHLTEEPDQNRYIRVSASGLLEVPDVTVTLDGPDVPRGLQLGAAGLDERQTYRLGGYVFDAFVMAVQAGYDCCKVTLRPTGRQRRWTWRRKHETTGAGVAHAHARRVHADRRAAGQGGSGGLVRLPPA